MKVDVFTPEDHVGDVIGDLNRRRGMIKDQMAGPTGVRIKADVPLAEMFGYIGSLRTMTSGRGQFSMEFSHYLPCPQSVADAVVEAEKERRKPKPKAERPHHCSDQKAPAEAFHRGFFVRSEPELEPLLRSVPSCWVTRHATAYC